ncbi:hypothetical protein FRB99_000061 [Tulasnella sp. 403]|nr:hypothetical protein FRB99_000061 [Tulasnella sp. 403]
MDDLRIVQRLHHRALSGKRPTKHGSGLATDSPLYDASEEDNDELGDDAASLSALPSPHLQRHVPRSPLGPNINANGLSDPVPTVGQDRIHKLKGAPSEQKAAIQPLDGDALDSPTYDGDVESSATAAFAPMSRPTSTSRTPGDPVEQDACSKSDLPPPSLSQPPLAPEEPIPADITVRTIDPASLTPEDIQAYVNAAINANETHLRKYRTNPPPEGRPVRVYADGVYDIFHFGHALQLRQAKLSFPLVHLLVGVCSDELCAQHKSRTVMSHAERCESVRHCRWVDEILPDAPWVIDQAFLDKHQIDYVAHDEDPYKGSDGSDDVYEYVKTSGRFIPTRRTPGVSTSELLERIVAGYREGDWDAKLVKIGHPELTSRAPSRTTSRPESRIEGKLAVPPPEDRRN